MTFRVNHQSSDNPARCPYRVVVQATGREIDWINRYLDYETVRRLADHTLQSYANELLYFLRWWESVHRTDAIAKDALTESTLLDYVRFLVSFRQGCVRAEDPRKCQPLRGLRLSSRLGWLL